MLQRLNMRVLDLLYIDDNNPYLKTTERQRTDLRTFVAMSAGDAQMCTTFDQFQFHTRDFSNSVITELNQDFAGGAVAVKIWKKLGMEIKKSSGQYLMPDDPSFEPLYQDIAHTPRP